MYATPATADIKPTTRPFRIWDAVARHHCRGRNYAYEQHAHNAALALVRWGKVGTAMEVYCVLDGRLLAQYVRAPTGIRWAVVRSGTKAHPVLLNERSAHHAHV